MGVEDYVLCKGSPATPCCNNAETQIGDGMQYEQSQQVVDSPSRAKVLAPSSLPNTTVLAAMTPQVEPETPLPPTPFTPTPAVAKVLDEPELGVHEAPTLRMDNSQDFSNTLLEDVKMPDPTASVPAVDRLPSDDAAGPTASVEPLPEAAEEAAPSGSVKRRLSQGESAVGSAKRVRSADGGGSSGGSGAAKESAPTLSQSAAAEAAVAVVAEAEATASPTAATAAPADVVEEVLPPRVAAVPVVAPAAAAAAEESVVGADFRVAGAGGAVRLCRVVAQREGRVLARFYSQPPASRAYAPLSTWVQARELVLTAEEEWLLPSSLLSRIRVVSKAERANMYFSICEYRLPPSDSAGLCQPATPSAAQEPVGVRQN
eukprot:Rhum_TRINITY_DN13603_c2_g1::Rhum_TRINITY_DN13603_c2_g1_i1::g.61796::m.61796